MSDALYEIHSVRCPAEFLDASGNRYFNDFESPLTGEDADDFGEITTEIAPFCGRYSSKNPTKIFNEDYTAVMIDSYSKVRQIETRIE